MTGWTIARPSAKEEPSKRPTCDVQIEATMTMTTRIAVTPSTLTIMLTVLGEDEEDFLDWMESNPEEYVWESINPRLSNVRYRLMNRQEDTPPMKEDSP